MQPMTAISGSNEGRACDAVLRHIEAREGQIRSDLSFPEKMHDVGPVELVCRLGAQRYAFEHTRIEPFAGHIRLEAEADRHFTPLSGMLAEKLPADERFELHVPAGVLLGKNDREVRPIQGALAQWIIATAPTLPIARFGRYAVPIQKVTVAGVPFAVSLHRWKREGYPVPFHVVHLVAEPDVAPARRERIRIGYHKKLGKLLKWKEAGARTVLILEEDDIYLTNHFAVCDALLEIESLVADRPDEVYLFSTGASIWFAVRLRIDGTTLYDMPVDSRYWETGRNLLDNITGR